MAAPPEAASQRALGVAFYLWRRLGCPRYPVRLAYEVENPGDEPEHEQDDQPPGRCAKNPVNQESECDTHADCADQFGGKPNSAREAAAWRSSKLIVVRGLAFMRASSVDPTSKSS